MSQPHDLDRLREVWLRYVDSKRHFLSVTERCSIRGWPDLKTAIRNAFRLQELFCDQEIMRFEHLATMWRDPASIACNSLTSVSAISKAIQQEWTETAEGTLQQSNPAYKKLVHEIEQCTASTTPEALDGPFRDARRDPEYIGARHAVQKALAACDKQLEAALIGKS
jgi:hypothetical protein